MCDVFIYFSIDLEGLELQDAAASGKLDAIGKFLRIIPQGMVASNLGGSPFTTSKISRS